MKDRVHYLDVAKGILILLLLMSHLAVALNWTGVDVNHSLLAPWYYPQPLFQVFFMQCFFIISGYCSNFELPAASFFKKLGKQILLPCLFFELFHVVYHLYLDDIDALVNGFKYVTLWFLKALLWAKLICWSVRRITDSVCVMLIITLVLLLFGIALNEFSVGRNLFSYRQGLVDSFFMAVGYAMKQSKRTYDVCLKYAGFVFLPLVAGHYLHYYRLPMQDVGIRVALSDSFQFLLASLSGSFAFLNLCRKISSNKVLEWFGRNTLVVYAMNKWLFIFVISLVLCFVDPSMQWQAVLFVFLVYVGVVIASALMIKLFNMSCLKFFVGRG